MRRFFAAVALFAASHVALADDIFVENTANLKPLLASVAKGITDPATDYRDKPCRLVGKRINLENAPAASDYFVTTAQGCGWGSAAGPVWLLHHTSDGYREVLATGAAIVRIQSSTSRGMKDLVLMSGDAGGQTESRWQFDGKQYRKTK